MTKNIEHQFNMIVREIRKECVGNGPREITNRFVGPWAKRESDEYRKVDDPIKRRTSDGS